MYENLVLQGGGVKGIALVGAYSILESRQCRFRTVIGASAGSIVGALIAAGFSSNEIHHHLMATNFKTFMDGGLCRLFFKRKFGMHSGDELRNWICKLLLSRRISTFNDLTDKELIIITSDITLRRPVVYSKATTPDAMIADAVRMSSSIPFFFDPIRNINSFVVDGGLISNFPIGQVPQLLDSATICLQLMASEPAQRSMPKTLMEYLLQIIDTSIEARDAQDLLSRKVDVIKIPVNGIPTTKFDLTEEEKTQLYQSGIGACATFLLNRDGILRRKVASTPLSISYEVPIQVNDDNVVAIRCSMSGLVRIKVNGKYLLVKGNRIRQFQAIGGVFKVTSKGRAFLDGIGATPDEGIPLDSDSYDDLRIRVPKANLHDFLEWFLSAKGRETSPEREFREEVLNEAPFDSGVFTNVEFEWKRAHVCGIRYSSYMRQYELLVADIFELIPDTNQLNAFNNSQQSLTNTSLRWANETQIKQRRFIEQVVPTDDPISDNASWLLEQDAS